jgi:dipeptidyl aminopeptidase/acylaminoacyl peptidase
MIRLKLRLLSGLLALVLLPLGASAQEPYRLPPQAVLDVLDAPPLPGVSVSPDRQWLLFSDRASMPGIEEVSEPMLRLAGYRINPATNGPHGAGRVLALRLKRIDTGAEHRVQTPDAAALGGADWSPDNRKLAFASATAT